MTRSAPTPTPPAPVRRPTTSPPGAAVPRRAGAHSGRRPATALPTVGLVVAALVGAAMSPSTGAAQAAPDTAAPPTIEEKTADTRPMEGFFDLYWDDRAGRLYLEIDRWEEEFLYQTSLSTGLGSNPVGLDRGQLGATRILEARRVGPRVLLVQKNYGYRARSDDPAERRAVEEAFAPSTIWGFDVVAETGDRALVDATDFFLRDVHGVVRTLRRSDQGSYRLDGDRSALHLPRTKSFPENTEVESSLTFAAAEDPGPLVQRTAADGDAFTVRQHHSLVRLPDAGYEPRRADPRVGAFGIEFHDFATPIDRDLRTRWVARHRLEKRDPSADASPPVEPLVYYVDPGVPEPIGSALIEGAEWWAEAFEAAGFRDAFRVRVLPDTADPMDIRYHVIHWTHRRTRGWSYGSSVVDPRTGEILKANVNLGSQRLRQDHMIGVGLTSPFGSGGEFGSGGASGGPRGFGEFAESSCDFGGGPDFGYLATAAAGTTPTEMALARIRQLSAHEVGHTLGLAHNFAASTYGRASVMDYPAPLVRVADDGTLDLSDAYDVGIGEYDAFAVRWLYADFPEGTDREGALDAIVREGLDAGMRFLSDADARPPGAAHPLAGLWDNGSDPVAALRHEMRVRRIALEDFGVGAVREGEPVAELEKVLVPLYLHHRYQVEATAHTLGGVDYAFAVRGDDQTPRRPVPADRQRAALEALLATLDPAELTLPDRILELLPPPAYGTPEGEPFERRTAPVFDAVGVAASAADFTLRFVLQPDRMARLVEQHARDGDLPGLAEVVDRLLDVTWRADAPGDPAAAAVDRAVERVVLDRLMAEAGSGDNPARVRAVLTEAAAGLADRLATLEAPDAHQRLALEDLRRWQDRPEGTTPPTRPQELPPGSPIGERN